MPQVVLAGAIGAAVVPSTFSFLGFTGALGGFVAYGGLALLGRALAPKIPSLSAQRQLRTQTVRSAISPARHVVGRARVAGDLAFVREGPDDDRTLHMILVLSEGPCAGIEGVWIDGDRVELGVDDRRSSSSLYPLQPAGETGPISRPDLGRERVLVPETETETVYVRQYRVLTQVHRRTLLTSYRVPFPLAGGLNTDRLRNFLAAQLRYGPPVQSVTPWTTYDRDAPPAAVYAPPRTTELNRFNSPIEFRGSDGARVTAHPPPNGYRTAYRLQQTLTRTVTETRSRQILSGADRGLADPVQWLDRFAELHGADATPQRVRCRPYEGDAYHGALELDCFAAGGNTSASATFPDAWDSAHRLDRLCSVHVRLTQPEHGGDQAKRVYPGIPEINFLLRGRKIAWPGQLRAVWTDNAAAVRYWYETEQVGRPPSTIDAAAYQAAHAICEARVGGRRRYSANGVVVSGEDPAYVGEQLDVCWQGHAVEQSGRLHFRPGADRQPAAHIDASDGSAVVGVGRFRAQPPIQERANTVSLTLAGSETNHWLEESLPPESDPGALARDGVALERDLGSWDLVSDVGTARRLRAILLRRLQHLGELEYVVTPGADFRRLRLLPTDVVEVTDPLLGLSRARYRIVSRRLESGADWAIRLTLEEHPLGIHADAPALPEVTPRKLDPPRGGAPPRAPRDLSVSVSTSAAPDGGISSALAISWRASRHPAVVRVRGPGGFAAQLPAAGSSADVQVPRPGTYSVSVSLLSSSGAESAPAAAEAVVWWGGLIPPAPVPLGYSARGAHIQIELAAAGHPDIAAIDIRYEYLPASSSAEFPAAPDWEDLRRMDVSPLAPSVPGGSTYCTASTPASGRYRLSGRYVTRQGVEGPAGDLGEHLLQLPIHSAGSYEAAPRWLGTAQSAARYGSPALLVVDPPHETLVRDAWDGRRGWPFGPAPAGRTPRYDGIPIRLAADSDPAIRIECRASLRYAEPPGAAVPADVSGVSCEIECRASDSASWTGGPVLAAGAGWAEVTGRDGADAAARMIRARISWGRSAQGAGLAGLRVDYRPAG